MHVSDFVKLSGGKVLTGEYEDREIVCGYTCDLLSHVMGKGQADMAWITVQAHMNVIAVAALLDFACVIIPEGLPVDETIVNKAASEDIIIVSCEQTSFELVKLLADAGVPSAKIVYFLSKSSTFAPRHPSILKSSSSSILKNSGHFFKISKYFFKFFSFC